MKKVDDPDEKRVSLGEFATSTSAHGFARVAQSRHLVMKALWIILIVAGFVVATIQIEMRFSAFIRRDTVTKTSMVFNTSLSFPAVTICNYNRYVGRRLNTMDRLYLNGATLYLAALSSKNSRAYAHINLDNIKNLNMTAWYGSGYTFANFTKDKGWLLNERNARCTFRGEDCNITADFKHVFTEFGNCYTFNSGDDPSRNLFQDQAGIGNGLRIEINIQQEQYTNLILRGDAPDAGILFHVHNQSEPASVETDGRAVGPGLTELQFGEIEVKKHVSSKDIYVDNNTDLDTDEVDIETDEVQRVSGGILTSVSGHVQVFQKPVEQDDTTANPEEGGNIDLGVYLTSNVTFTLTLRKHVKRSVEGVQRMEAVANAQFQKRSLVGQYDQVSAVYQRWTVLRKKFDEEDKLGQAVTNFMKDPTDPSKLYEVNEILSLENELGMPHNTATSAAANTPALVKQLIQVTKEVVSKCSENWEICKEILDLHITAGGKDVEKILSDLVLSHPLSTEQKQELVQKLSFIAKPTNHILTTVKTLWNTLSSQGDPSQSHAILTLGSLASKETTSKDFRSELVDLLRRHLQSGDKNNNTEQISDALEAIGNFGDNRLTPDVLAIAKKEGQVEEIEIGCIHALRRNFHIESVQQWLVDLLTRPTSTCELREAAVMTIKGELAYRKALDTKNKAWPNSGLTDIDTILLNALFMADAKYECAFSDIKEYLQLKGVSIGTHTETYEMVNSTRTKRGVDHTSCSSWSTHGSRYSDLLSSGQFSSDNSLYPDNKHCLSHISYGPSKAHVYVKSGVFAGIDKRRGHCKVYGKSVAKIKVFSKTLTLATAEVYRYKASSSRTKVYLHVYGKTVVNIYHSGPLYKNYPIYRPSPKTITVFRFYIYVAKISVTITLAPTVDFSVRAGFCSRSTDPCSHCLTMTLKAGVRISGGASASLAALVRGGIDVGVTLNYLIEGEGKLYPGICFSIYHGHDPMKINIQAWYQIRSKFKIRGWRFWKWRWTWGNRKTWRPSSLSWSLGKSSRRLIARAGRC
ncbi:uncharacterized protein LOC106164620 [Lingula anatina]|uniref:Uncharacterized protein LOC106164620 n=1 Tax=Lingula anatina TaxID=7574 RepID=A0A1S3IIH5_LINAN|nr:uncharacterized protein LOC106164620 [Lingula anatina]|eukprot:XP_013398040.1 uncharacterized protein LOC106164620 [Lingula anatina]